jgi:hypothetical protein
MFKLLARKTPTLAKMKVQLIDQLYETQRDRLIHASAAERHNCLAAMCLVRKARLEHELMELSILPSEKEGLFCRVTIATLVTDQLRAAQIEYLDNTGQAEHHHALAVMYQGRVVRLRAQVKELTEFSVVATPVAITESASTSADNIVSKAMKVSDYTSGTNFGMPSGFSSQKGITA